MLFNGLGNEDLITFLPFIAKRILTSFIGWLLLLTPYFIYRIIKHLRMTWIKKGRNKFVQQFSLIILLPAAVIFSGFKISQWYTQSENYVYSWDHSYENTTDSIANRFLTDGKQRGVHVFGHGGWDDEAVEYLLQTNTEWVTLVPFGYQEDYNTTEIGRRKQGYTSWSRRDSSFMQKATDLQKAGFHIMMKPHVWIGDPSAGKWRSDIQHKNEQDWKQWSKNYRDFILHYTRMSNLLQIEQLCIGTELHQTVKDHPDFWKSLIQEVRSIYQGKLTYAANWNEEINDVSFWEDLDFIGIQAYFPLTQKKTPSVRELKRGWKKHIKSIEGLSKKFNKPILFTEVGYKSTVDSGIEPWAWADNFSSMYQKVSFETQANCYEAVFQTFWNKEWFAGIHFWEWNVGYRPKSKDQRKADSDRNRERDQRKNINFTPQGKPAENIMTKWFARISNH